MSNQYDGQSGRKTERIDSGKIFVGGLSRDTGDDELRDYFMNYGNVVECMVKRDPNTGHSRGFGFVTFKEPSGVDKVLAERQHTLQGKVIDPKRAQARGSVEVCRKIFVGGLDPNFEEDKIREYFGRFGKIDLIEQPFDREKNVKKGFCFITFESGDAVEVICANAKHHVGGRDVDVKKATPKEKMAAAQAKGGMGSGRGGGAGRGRGGDAYGGWEGQQDYSAAPGYAAAYDYSAYYAAQPPAGMPSYGAYGQAPMPYQTADPYGQAYGVPPAPTGAYDYSAWYGAAAAQPPAQQNGGGAMYGRGQRPADGRFQPY